MRMFIHPQRKDGKFPVTFTYSNGVTIQKLRTEEKLIEDAKAGYQVFGRPLLYYVNRKDI